MPDDRVLRFDQPADTMSNGTALILDPSELFRFALRHFLTSPRLRFRRFIEAASLEDVQETLAHTTDDPDLLVLSAEPHGKQNRSVLDDPTVILGLRQRLPGTRIAVTSESVTRGKALRILGAGAHAVLPKTLASEDWVSVVAWVMAGGIYVPSSIADLPQDSDDQYPPTMLVGRSGGLAAAHPSQAAWGGGGSGEGDQPQRPSGGRLTHRQNAVLALLVAGKSNKEIARALQLSEGTIKLHIAALFRILSVSNRASAAVAGARMLAAAEGASALRDA
jgi:DNA-binding NarL/FixJ family response regulator